MVVRLGLLAVDSRLSWLTIFHHGGPA
jgi:hypothetical protein